MSYISLKSLNLFYLQTLPDTDSVLPAPNSKAHPLAWINDYKQHVLTTLSMAFIASGSLNAKSQLSNKPEFWLICDTLSGSSEGILTKWAATVPIWDKANYISTDLSSTGGLQTWTMLASYSAWVDISLKTLQHCHRNSVPRLRPTLQKELMCCLVIILKSQSPMPERRTGRVYAKELNRKQLNL